MSTSPTPSSPARGRSASPAARPLDRGRRSRSARGLGLLALALAVGFVGGACRKQQNASEQPDTAPSVDDLGPEVDVAKVCRAGCSRLERCVPELGTETDGDPSVIANRLASECDPACSGFEDPRSSLALRDCLGLGSCEAFWGCVGTEPVRPWLAAVAPVGERSCENLCSQASACAIAKVCEAEPEGRRGRPAKATKVDGNAGAGIDGSGGGATPADEDASPSAACMADAVRRSELEETCLLQCQGAPAESQARRELVGCIDHGSCEGMLHCLDSWAETDYGDEAGPVPGISAACDDFCTRAIVCGAAEEELELSPEELDELKQAMTSTYVECAVQCGQDIHDDAASERFATCTAVESCDEFMKCADEM